MKKRICYHLTIAYLLMTCLTGCGQNIPDTPSLEGSPSSGQSDNPSVPFGENAVGEDSPSDSVIPDDTEGGTPGSAAPAQDTPSVRDNTPLCLVPTADGTAETHNDVAAIDYSNASSGYVMASYTGTCPKVKLRVTGPDDIVYTYDLHGDGYETFPLSSGDGDYAVTIYENISGTNYATCLHAQVSVQLSDEFAPFLYPNQYVNFTAESRTVLKGAELASTATSDLEVVSNIYDYITSSISYDYNKASDPPTGYTTDVDAILESGTGICLDYAAVMASMLRSQRIPTRLEVGYAQDAYHAWISVYIEEMGWLNGIIEFDGENWTLVDPTFGANTDSKTLKKFIGDGSNYILQKMY